MDQVEEIKQKVNITEVVGGFVELKRAGRNLKGLCPFHDEKSPSFMVNEELAIYKCFGCGAGGDVFKFLMEIEGLDFGEALQRLADRAGIKLVRRDGSSEKSEKTKLYEVNSLAREYYHYLLTEHRAGDVAREYLKGRGIGEKLIKTFKLGFAIDEWDGLATYLIKKKGYDKAILLRSGLLIDSDMGGYDRFRGRVIFPFTDSASRVVGFSGRTIPALVEGKSAEAMGAKYVNSPETTVYHKSEVLFGLEQARQAMKKNNRVVVTEGPMDMISSYAAGITETVAVNGTALTVQMLKMISRICDRVILSMDADVAGETAIKRSIEEAEKLNLSIRVIDIVGGKDPDEVARKDPSSWKKQVEGAVEVYEFVINRSIKKWGTTGAEAMKRISEEVLPYVSKINNSVVRAYWVTRLAKVLKVDEQRVWDEMEKIGKIAMVGVVAEQKEVGVVMSRYEMLGWQLLAMLLVSNKDQITRVREILRGLNMTDSLGKSIVLVLNLGEIVQLSDFIQSAPEELRNTIKEAYMIEIDEDDLDRNVEKTAIEMANEMVKLEQKNLSEDIQRLEEEGDKDGLATAGRRFTELLLRKKPGSL